MEKNKQDKKDAGKSVNCDITPETKIGSLLDSYPELENTLMNIAPAFKKLKNPVLRKTVAKVTTLRHAAKIGNVSLADMINRLREEAGLTETTEPLEENQNDSEKPGWINNYEIVKTLDARKMIEEGKHPVDQVVKELSLLEKSQIFELITPFSPAPLIDIARSKGFLAWSEEKDKAFVKTFFAKQE